MRALNEFVNFKVIVSLCRELLINYCNPVITVGQSSFMDRAAEFIDLDAAVLSISLYAAINYPRMSVLLSCFREKEQRPRFNRFTGYGDRFFRRETSFAEDHLPSWNARSRVLVLLPSMLLDLTITS